MLRDQIIDFLRQHHSGVDQSKLADPQATLGEMGLDSLGMVEMLFEIEDRYGFQIEDPTRYQGMTIDQVAVAIEETIRAHHGGQMPDAAPPPADHA